MEHDGKQSIAWQQECLQGEAVDILVPTTRSPIAIGVAAALNCHPCLKYLVLAAVQNGVLEEEIEAIIFLVEQIRGRASGFTDKLVTDMLDQKGMQGESKRDGC